MSDLSHFSPAGSPCMASKKKDAAFGSLRCPLLQMFWALLLFTYARQSMRSLGKKQLSLWFFAGLFLLRAIYMRHVYRFGEKLIRRRDGHQSQDEFGARERGPTPLPSLTNPPAATRGVHTAPLGHRVQLAICYSLSVTHLCSLRRHDSVRARAPRHCRGGDERELY